MKYKNLFFSVGMAAAMALSVSCEKEEENENVFNTPETEGLMFANSELSAQSVYDNVIADLKSKAAIGIVAEVDHKANASNVDIDLRDTKLVMFGNPALGTPLMQKNQLAGLDLPQKMMVYSDMDNNTVVAYNDVEYIRNRYDLGEVETIETMKGALKTIAESASEATVSGNDADDVDFLEGVIIKESANDFETTLSGIMVALNDIDKIKIIAELDHQANAASVGQDLRPTKLIVFGNPELGSPLMANSQTTAIDLPQKILVYQAEDGKTMIAYNDPEYIKERHDIEENDVIIGQIKGALDAITDAGAE